MRHVRPHHASGSGSDGADRSAQVLVNRHQQTRATTPMTCDGPPPRCVQPTLGLTTWTSSPAKPRVGVVVTWLRGERPAVTNGRDHTKPNALQVALDASRSANALSAGPAWRCWWRASSCWSSWCPSTASWTRARANWSNLPAPSICRHSCGCTTR